MESFQVAREGSYRSIGGLLYIANGCVELARLSFGVRGLDSQL